MGYLDYYCYKYNKKSVNRRIVPCLYVFMNRGLIYMGNFFVWWLWKEKQNWARVVSLNGVELQNTMKNMSFIYTEIKMTTGGKGSSHSTYPLRPIHLYFK